MTLGRWLSVGLGALVFGLVTALVTTGDSRVVSLQVGLGAALVFVTAGVASTLTRRFPVAVQRPRPLLARVAPDLASPVPRPTDLLAMDRDVGLALRDPRAFDTTLRPRLVELAAHYLRTAHGLTWGSDTDRARQVLGPTAWLVEDEYPQRVPTAEEILDFADRVRGDGDDG